MAVTQQKSDRLLAALDSSIPRHRYKTTIGVKSKGRGFARPTKASKLKQVTQAPREMLVDGAKCESVVMLKNLAKLLVDRIEAACAARNTLDITQVYNLKRNLNTAPPSRLLHGTNSGRNADQEVGNSCQSLEYGSNLDADESCAVSTQSPSLGIQQLYGQQLGDDRSCQSFKEINRSCDYASRGTLNHGSSICETSETCRPNSHPSSQPNPCGSTCDTSRGTLNHGSIICETSDTCRPNSRPSSQPNPSGSTCDTSETFEGLDSHPSSRTPTREWTARKVASLRSRMLTLKKVNVGLDDSEIKTPKKGVHPTPGRKIRSSPGLRSLVVPQVKSLQTPPARPPANTKLVLQKSPEEVKGKEENSALKGVKDSKPEELYEAVWADVVHNLFDEFFGDQGKQPSQAANKKQLPPSHQVSRPPAHGSEEWIFQTRSIEYSYSTDGNDLFS